MRPSGRIPYIPRMKSTRLLFCLLLPASCGRPGVNTEMTVFDPAQKTMVILDVIDPGSMPDIPDGLAWSRFSLTDRYPDDTIESLLSTADSCGKLMMLLEYEPGTELPDPSRQHMFITLDELHRPVAVFPEGLAPDLHETSITPGPEGHGTVLLLLEKYRPDLLFISMNDPGPDSLSALLVFWSESATNRDFRFIILSTPTPESRGWCAMNWRGIQGGFVPGLSFEGFEKTLAILAGLPWDQSVFTGVPAATVLNTREQNP